MNNVITIKSYNEHYKTIWDAFIDQSKNGVFLFKRDYMEYHSDRFSDHSLIFYHNENVVACLPANLNDNSLYSHQGLTYGGLIMSKKVKARMILDVMDTLVDYCRSKGFQKLVYKSIPSIYHQLPADEDSYALFRQKAVLFRRDLSSSIYLDAPFSISKGKLEHKKNKDLDRYMIQQLTQSDSFFVTMNDVLNHKYDVNSTHTSTEMDYLMRCFPENIRLFSISENKTCLAGAIIYITDTCVHVQYMAANPKGQKLQLLDRLICYLIDLYKSSYRYFDFGISTENNGLKLNEGLIHFKEMYHARGICYNQYEIPLDG